MAIKAVRKDLETNVGDDVYPLIVRAQICSGRY